MRVTAAGLWYRGRQGMPFFWGWPKEQKSPAMGKSSNSEKGRAHELIDQLDDAQVSAVVPLLQFLLLDPVSRSLAAALVEAETAPAEEAAGMDEARASLDRGERIAHEDILREFGLSSR